MKIKSKTSIKSGDNSKEVFRKILQSRGLTTTKQIDQFLNPNFPSLTQLRKELDLKNSDLSLTQKIITSAIHAKEDICIYGDYDTDGVTSTAILWKTLNSLGARALPFIPHRKVHGYGMSKKALDEIVSGDAFQNSPLSPFKPTLIITTDNGIVAHEEIKYLKSKGIKVILTDHHQPEVTLPEADVIIHTTETSAAGIAWTLSRYLTDDSDESKRLIDLASVGIIADQIPLTNINRNIVASGLKELKNTSNTGLQKIYELTGIQDRDLSTYDVNFVIAPRINAMGRLGHALDALRLLCTTDTDTATRLSSLLEETNKTRQDMTYEAIGHARGEIDDNKIVIVASGAYHEGIIGLIAGKITEETGKPSLAISIGEDGMAKGSARSVSGIDIVELLRANSKFLESVGGHKLAAGFSLKSENLTFFKKAVFKYASANITTDQLDKSLVVDGELSLNQSSRQLFDLITEMQPFGIGNPRPRFVTHEINVVDSKPVGNKGQHLKMTINQRGKTQESIWFNSTKSPDEITSIIYTVGLNQWNNREYLQLLIKHAF